ncbi:hypothetical protein ACH5RR_027339 [Cinchona calisaya]|uniref:Uncharacterized protein n=1 Tax=Cinchona calisaya TaxID=153742 RepID=A0ABD2Z926_9GENT
MPNVIKYCLRNVYKKKSRIFASIARLLSYWQLNFFIHVSVLFYLCLLPDGPITHAMFGFLCRTKYLILASKSGRTWSTYSNLKDLKSIKNPFVSNLYCIIHFPFLRVLTCKVTMEHPLI